MVPLLQLLPDQSPSLPTQIHAFPLPPIRKQVSKTNSRTNKIKEKETNQSRTQGTEETEPKKK